MLPRDTEAPVRSPHRLQEAAPLLSGAQDKRGNYLSVGGGAADRHATGRITKWAAELAEFDLEFVPQTAVKSQALADFIAEWTPAEEEEDDQVGPHGYLQPTPVQFTETPWDMAFDGSARQGVAGAGVVITSPTGEKIKYVFRILFEESNNATEYEALIAGLKAAHSLGV